MFGPSPKQTFVHDAQDNSDDMTQSDTFFLTADCGVQNGYDDLIFCDVGNEGDDDSISNKNGAKESNDKSNEKAQKNKSASKKDKEKKNKKGDKDKDEGSKSPDEYLDLVPNEGNYRGASRLEDYEDLPADCPEEDGDEDENKKNKDKDKNIEKGKINKYICTNLGLKNIQDIVFEKINLSSMFSRLNVTW